MRFVIIVLLCGWTGVNACVSASSGSCLRPFHEFEVERRPGFLDHHEGPSSPGIIHMDQIDDAGLHASICPSPLNEVAGLDGVVGIRPRSEMFQLVEIVHLPPSEK